MTKGELFAALDDVGWDDIVFIETENGLFPICHTDSGTVDDEVLGKIAVLAPCYCDFDEDVTEEEIKLDQAIDDAIDKTPDPQNN